MKEYQELAWLMERTIHKYNQYEKKPQKYCSDLILTQPEIHTVAIIGDQEGISVTELAKVRGITKGAASQMIYRLEDKDLVEKRISPESDSKLNLYLTKKGKKARNEHRKKHETMGTKFAALMENIPADVQKYMIEFLQDFSSNIRGIVESRGSESVGTYGCNADLFYFVDLTYPEIKPKRIIQPVFDKGKNMISE